MKIVDEIIKSLIEEKEQWEKLEFHLNKKGDGEVLIWVANGLFFYALKYPASIDFNFIDKIRFHFAYKRWQSEVSLKQLTKETL